MKQYVVYSSSFINDYRFIVKSDFLPNNVWSIFKEQILGSVKTENMSEALTTPRWLFSRYEKYTLWGMAAYNGSLASDSKYAIDCTGHDRQLRVFLGIVSDEDFSCMPIDENLFKLWYKAIVEPVWNLPIGDSGCFQSGKICVDSFDKYQHILPQASVILNQDSNKVRFCGDNKNIFEYMSSALASNGDVSCMGIIKEVHKGFASMKKYHYMNVVVENQISNVDVLLKEEIPSQRKKEVRKENYRQYDESGREDGWGIDDVDRSGTAFSDDKNDFSKKAIASVVVICILLLVLIIHFLKKR